MSSHKVPPTVTPILAPPSNATTIPHDANESLHRNSKKSKIDNADVTEEQRDIEMTDTTHANETVKSFKDALLETGTEEVFADECWGDLLQHEMPEDRWYKEPADDTNKLR